MLIAFLLVILIIAVIFHKEIKALISFGIFALIAYGTWIAGGWWRLVDIGFILFVIGGIVKYELELRQQRKDQTNISK